MTTATLPKPKLAQLRLSELVLDWDLYPRQNVDSQHVGNLCDAIRGGASLPPIIVDAKSKRVIDGFHRYRAFRREFDGDPVIGVELREYASDREMLLDAIRLNASHGRALTKQDKTRCLLLAKKYRVAVKMVAQALCMRPSDIKALAEGRVASSKSGRPVPLKRGLDHLAGATLTDEQIDVLPKLSGMPATFHARQLILLIETGMLNTSDADTMEVLRELYCKLETVI